MNNDNKKKRYILCLGCIVLLSACSSIEGKNNKTVSNAEMHCTENAITFNYISEPYRFIDEVYKCDISIINDDLFNKYASTLMKVGHFKELNIILNKKEIDMDEYLYIEN
jgi:PBP1b-binding outer membrane lipoprotein LpoB